MKDNGSKPWLILTVVILAMMSAIALNLALVNSRSLHREVARISEEIKRLHPTGQ